MRMDCWSLYKIYGFLYHISAVPLILEGKNEGLRPTHGKTSWTKSYLARRRQNPTGFFPLKKSGKYERELGTISELAQDYQGIPG